MRLVIYFVGTFFFGAAPLGFTWAHSANATHHFDASRILDSPEGWLYCIAIATAVIVDTAAEKSLGPTHLMIALGAVGILGWSAFEYGEMLSDISKPSSLVDSWWPFLQGGTIIFSLFFAAVVKLSQNARNDSERIRQFYR